MFVIVYDYLKDSPEELDDFEFFDSMTNRMGCPMKFKTVKQSLNFLNLVGIDSEAIANSDGYIRIDRFPSIIQCLSISTT